MSQVQDPAFSAAILAPDEGEYLNALGNRCVVKIERTAEEPNVNTNPKDIPGYSYGSPDIAPSTISMEDFADLKVAAGFTEETERDLRLAGEVLGDQAEQIVNHWRSGIIAGIPHLAKHSRSPEGEPDPFYLGRSNLRFQQWIKDTCLRPYNQDWLNYQQEIALRHTTVRKNQVDGVQSTPFVPLSDIIAFVAIMNETIKPYLASKGHQAADVDRMHQAWCKSLQLQLALWVKPYAQSNQG